MMLEKLENINQIHFEVTMLNMLYIIQLGAKLQNIAQNITRSANCEHSIVCINLLICHFHHKV